MSSERLIELDLARLTDADIDRLIKANIKHDEVLRFKMARLWQSMEQLMREKSRRMDDNGETT